MVQGRRSSGKPRTDAGSGTGKALRAASGPQGKKRTGGDAAPLPEVPFPGGLAGLAAAARAPASELLEGLGFELCALEIAGGSSGKILRFTADRRTQASAGSPWRGSGITLDDCAELSKALSVLLDDLWPGDGSPYVLEVSSPGLDRPLESEADLLRFSGSLAKLKLRRGGRTLAVSGRLRCSPGALAVVPEAPPPKPGKPRPAPEPVTFEWAEVAKARLLPEF
ncbi:MAG: hypothetical protein LBR80_07085 [Deltaproteobacteria bacterium]|jgi:ribosome maturation factor RimP|nr:hypothetical protein [Deltaproteobacteria bacterium]